MKQSNLFHFKSPITTPSTAVAYLKGSTAYPSLRGMVSFYPLIDAPGVMIEAEFFNLPVSNNDAPSFMGFHIHENGDCSQDFKNTGMHYNPNNAEHPHHLGDLVPILNNDGYAYQVFYDSFLSIPDLLDRSVVLHSQRDDFTTQPSGDSKEKIACGVIQKVPS